MKLITKLLTGSMLLITGSANAALISFDITGYVLSATNYGGLTGGDTITASITLDDTGLTGTSEEKIFFTGSNTLDITAGTYLFDESMDTALSASITFTDGYLSNLDFSTLTNDSLAPEDFDSSASTFNASRTDIVKGKTEIVASLSGRWDNSELLITSVPVPAAVWLFGSGLLGLVGIARRKAV